MNVLSPDVSMCLSVRVNGGMRDRRGSWILRRKVWKSGTRKPSLSVRKGVRL